jgi:hypothetical protein
MVFECGAHRGEKVMEAPEVFWHNRSEEGKE